MTPLRSAKWRIGITRPDARVLGLEPQRLHFVEIGAFWLASALGETLLDMGEAALELGVRAAQRSLRIDVEMAGEVDGGKQEVADLVRQPFRRAIADFRFDLRDLLAQLGDDGANVVPVEPDLAGLLLQFQRA